MRTSSGARQVFFVKGAGPQKGEDDPEIAFAALQPQSSSIRPGMEAGAPKAVDDLTIRRTSPSPSQLHLVVRTHNRTAAKPREVPQVRPRPGRSTNLMRQHHHPMDRRRPRSRRLEHGFSRPRPSSEEYQLRPQQRPTSRVAMTQNGQPPFPPAGWRPPSWEPTKTVHSLPPHLHGVRRPRESRSAYLGAPPASRLKFNP